MKTVAQIIDEVIAREGGYVNDPADRGGETNFGITVAVARANGWTGPMADLPVSVARDIYKQRYVVEPKFDQVAERNVAIGLELIDTGVNMGPHRAAEFLQRWLNGFNYAGRWQELFIDGRLGAVSLEALGAYIDWRKDEGVEVMLGVLNGVQAARYLEITEANKAQRKFLYGWVKERTQ